MPRPQNKPHDRKSCGAIVKTGPNKGNPCPQTILAPNGKCHKHGGKVGEGHGAPEGNQNAKTHGLYSKSLGPLGLEVYGQAKSLGADEIARDTAEFIVAKVAEAFHSDSSADGLLFQMIAQLEENGDIDERTADIYRSKLAAPRPESLGRIIAPLKGLLEVKKADEAAAENGEFNGSLFED